MIQHPNLPLILSLLLCCWISPAFAVEDGSGGRLFTEKVQPLFVQKCAGCHGDSAKKIKGGFDMRSRAGLLKGGDSGNPSIVPGKPEESPLYIAVTWEDPEMEMPPKENDRLDPAQIEDLREWIRVGAPWPEKNTTSGGLPEPTDGTVRVKTSGGQSDTWTHRTYDPEVIWAFHPVANSKPPSSGHPIDAFVSAELKGRSLSPAPRANGRTLTRRIVYSLTGLPPNQEQLSMEYDVLLEQLLGSRHYGERMAQHWLDVTRYADSNGFARDDERPDAHIYRSYVVESFNGDKPFDRFVKEQIAGDELGIAGQDALAFLWMGPWEMTAMTANAVARQMWLDDVVNSVGVTFLGQELRCAKCHDHKFDPIPTRDYYAMHAVFAGTKHHVKEGTYKIQPQKPKAVSILKGGSLESPTETVRPGLLSAIPNATEYRIPTQAKGRRAALAKWIASKGNTLTSRVIVNRVWQWHFGRGLVATPNGFGSMGAKPTHPELLDWLANWFVENGWSIKKLNRLILTSATYQRSTAHPQLENLRTVDPDNQLLAVFKPRRLSAEELRDSMLSVSGELDLRVGGESFRAEINWEVAFQPRLAMGKVLPPWQPEPKRADRNRRSLYAKRMRNLGHPLMEVLNRPPTELSCERRDETTVVTQAFSLFHGEFTNARALALAARAAKEKPGDPKAQIGRVFQLAYGREPSGAELETSLAHVMKMAVHHEANPPKEKPLPTEVTVSNIIEKTGEPELITFQLDILKNYERDLQPWDVDHQTRALAELCLVLLNSSEFLHIY